MSPDEERSLKVKLNQAARDELRLLIRNAELLRYSLLGVAEEIADGRLDPEGIRGAVATLHDVAQEIQESAVALDLESDLLEEGDS